MSEKIKLKFSSFWDSAEANNTRVEYNWGTLPPCFELTAGNDYDFLIVLNHSHEMCSSPREKNIAVTMEPTWSVNSLENLNDYCKYIITSDKKIKGENVRYTHSFLFTHDSRNNSDTQNLYGPTVEEYLSDDCFPEGVDSPEYPKKMSYMVANHGALAGAPQRPASTYFIRESLLAKILDSDLDIDIYGKGWSINDSRYKGAPPLKRDALKNYKYSICIENSCEDLYISEKFFDAFLNNCVPVYYGCKTVKSAYNENAFITFDAASENAIKILKDIIEQPISHRLSAIKECKNDYFTKYNLLKYLETFIKEI
jgi:hypothetical protein